MKFQLEDESNDRFEELAKALGYDDFATDEDADARDKRRRFDRDDEFVTE